MKARLLLLAVSLGALVGCYPIEEYRGDVDSCSGDLNFSPREAWLMFDHGSDDPPGWFGWEDVLAGTYRSGPISRLKEEGGVLTFDVEWEAINREASVELERDEDDLQGEVTFEQGNESTDCDLDLRRRSP